MAKVTYLEFEKPVAQLEEKIQELRDMSSGSEGLDLTSDINGLERVPARFEVPFGIGFNDFCHDRICLGKLFFRLLPPFGLTGLLCHRH
jgi:hypothetical protein